MSSLIVILVASALATLFAHCVRESQRNLKERLGFARQPDTTDTEFCKLIPDVSPEVALKVRQICSDASGWEREEIHPNTRIIEFELW